jgi:hypothetical protein
LQEIQNKASSRSIKKIHTTSTFRIYIYPYKVLWVGQALVFLSLTAVVGLGYLLGSCCCYNFLFITTNVVYLNLVIHGRK